MRSGEVAVPQKIRVLKARLSKAGFFLARTRGSHTVWMHPFLSEPVVIAGKDGQDAKPYQERDVEAALKALKEQERRK